MTSQNRLELSKPLERFIGITILFFICNLLSNAMYSQQTVGLFTYEEEAYSGYTLFNPLRSTSTYLIDNCGRLINEWEGPYTPGNGTYLLENGNLLRTAKTSLNSNPIIAAGGAGERVQLLDWDSNVLWDYVYSDSTKRMHHDIEPLPNGNVLILAWDLRTYDECIEAGRNPDLLPDSVIWSEHIVEVKPIFPDSGEIVWEWYLWDHLVQDFDSTKSNFGDVFKARGKLDINYTADNTADGGADWLHANSIDYNPMMDQILLSSPFLSEIYIIDHSTTTAEAATNSGGTSKKGGDLLFRWGNPQIYKHGDETDQILFRQHDVHWIPQGLPGAGDIMIFNNGNGRPDINYSSIDVITPPVDDYITGQYIYVSGKPYLPEAPNWSYIGDPVESFYSSFISGAQRLPNGNTLICAGAQGRFFEIDADQQIVWDYVNPADTGVIKQFDPVPILFGRNSNITFRCTRYSPDYQAFDNVDLTPGDPLELEFIEPYTCEIISNTFEPQNIEFSIYPNPVNNVLNIDISITDYKASIYDLNGKLMKRINSRSSSASINVSDLSSGMYLLNINDSIPTKFIIVR